MKSTTGSRRLNNAGNLAGSLLTVAMSLAPVAAQTQYNFTTFTYPGATGLYTGGINDEGVAVGSADIPQGIQGFVRSADGNFSFFSFLGTVKAYGINDSAQSLAPPFSTTTRRRGLSIQMATSIPSAPPEIVERN